MENVILKRGRGCKITNTPDYVNIDGLEFNASDQNSYGFMCNTTSKKMLFSPKGCDHQTYFMEYAKHFYPKLKGNELLMKAKEMYNKFDLQGRIWINTEKYDGVISTWYKKIDKEVFSKLCKKFNLNSNNVVYAYGNVVLTLSSIDLFGKLDNKEWQNSEGNREIINQKNTEYNREKGYSCDAERRFREHLDENVEDDEYMIGGEEDGNLGYFHIKENIDVFPNSKVRNADGTLKVMYRGDNNDIDCFDRKHSKYSNIYGTGFYFTDDKSHASQYGNIKSYYLNITNPLSTTERTIKPKMLLRFLDEINTNEDYGLYNYGYESTPQTVLRTIYSKNKSDFELLNDINSTCIGDLVKTTLMFNDINNTNFDGFILDTETVVFDDSQIVKLGNLSENIENEYIAYHGSRNDFNKFNHKKYLSSGAGSQSFGWGTYVTDDEAIAKSYANIDDTKVNVRLNGNIISVDDTEIILESVLPILKQKYPTVYNFYISTSTNDKEYLWQQLLYEMFDKNAASDKMKEMYETKKDYCEKKIKEDHWWGRFLFN